MSSCKALCHLDTNTPPSRVDFEHYHGGTAGTGIHPGPDASSSSILPAGNVVSGFPQELMRDERFRQGLIQKTWEQLNDEAKASNTVPSNRLETTNSHAAESALPKPPFVEFACAQKDFGIPNPVKLPSNTMVNGSGWARRFPVDNFQFADVLKNNIRDPHITTLTQVQSVIIQTTLPTEQSSWPPLYIVAVSPPGVGKTVAHLAPVLQSLVLIPQRPSPAHPKVVTVSHARDIAIQIYKTACGLAKNTGVELRLVHGAMLPLTFRSECLQRHTTS